MRELSGALVLGLYIFHSKFRQAREQRKPAPARTPRGFWGACGSCMQAFIVSAPVTQCLKPSLVLQA